jgi:hypothetical protein
MNKNKKFSQSNLAMLELAARQLGKLTKEVVFLGGCTTALFITDPLLFDVRPTTDVDCIIDVISLSEYYAFEEALRKQGFKQSMNDDVICRWHYDELILDVMPTDEKILGFTSCWYKDAIKNAMEDEIADGIFIRRLTAPYFLGIKIEAFKARGNNDFFMSHDFEDIITVINGRDELIDELSATAPELKKYISTAFENMIKKNQFQQALPGHLEEGPVTQDRVKIVLKRIKQIITLKP